MMPTHRYNRQTLLMMQNLHNNYLYSANTGILFTMQRGWNSGIGAIHPHSGTATNGKMIIGNSFKNLTNIGRIRKNFLNKNATGVETSEVINGLNAAGTINTNSGLGIINNSRIT